MTTKRKKRKPAAQKFTKSTLTLRLDPEQTGQLEDLKTHLNEKNGSTALERSMVLLLKYNADNKELILQLQKKTDECRQMQKGINKVKEGLLMLGLYELKKGENLIDIIEEDNSWDDDFDN